MLTIILICGSIKNMLTKAQALQIPSSDPMVQKELRMQPTSHTNVKIENNKYYARFSVNGQRIDGVLLQSKTEDEAVIEMLELKKKYLNDEFSGPNTTFDQLLPKFLGDQLSRVKRQKLSQAWLTQINSVINSALKPYYKDIKVSKMSSIKLWDGFCDQSSLKDFTKARVILQMFLKWAANPDNGGYVTGMLPTFPIPSHERRSGVEHSDAVLDKIYSHIEDQDLRDIFFILRYTGRRKREIEELTWDRVDFKNNTITTREKDTATKKKTTIPVVLEVMNLIRKRVGNNSKYVFPGLCKDLPYHKDHFKSQWILIKDRAEAPEFKLKDLRSTFSSQIKKKYGLDNKEVAIYLGHDERMQTAVYDQAQEAAKQKVVNAISKRPELKVVR